jgi:uncharacterized protein (TIGR03437 family)
MTRTFRTLLFLSSGFWMALAPTLVHAQNFDTSGTANLSGKYLFRYVNFFNDQNGNLTESCTLSGAITFDGVGSYTLSGTQLNDSSGSNGTGSCASLGGGSYGVQSNGMAQLDNPLYPATLFGTFSQPVVIASSTEDDYFDLFVAVQAPASSSNSSLSGNFTVGTLDFLNSSASLARQGYFTLKADGQGNIAAFAVTGSLQNVNSGATVTQNVAASTYSLSGAAGGTVTFPGNSSDETDIVSGKKILYVSADGNWFVGGSATGSDMFFGFRAPSGTSSNSLLSGTYYTAGMEDNVGEGAFGLPDDLDAFYGSINTSGNGMLISHQRLDDVVDVDTYDNTFDTPVTIGADGSYYDGNIYTYLAGSNGAALMQIGSNQQYSLILGMRAPSFTAPSSSSVWINPIGITNAANYTPITNAYAPGEMVNLYGTFGVSTQVEKVLPIPTTLGGVQVFVNGQAAPVYQVSQNQISALIPYEVAGEYFATFQVVVNGSKSNLVTAYVDNSAPGIYTLSENGIGAGAILHSNYTQVTANSPAVPGETVLMFLNGLGPVTPQVGDGAAASGSPLSVSVEAPDIDVFLEEAEDFAFPEISFAGLAPGLPGLYQVNFTMPTSGLEDGDVDIVFNTTEALNEMATISVSGFSGRARQIAALHSASRLRSRIFAPGAHAKRATNFRRALPSRPE